MDLLTKEQIDPTLLEPSIRYAFERMEEALQQQSTAMSMSIDGIAILNVGGEFVYVNDALVKMHGYDQPDDLIGNSWRVLYEDEAGRRFEREIMPRVSREGRWR